MKYAGFLIVACLALFILHANGHPTQNQRSEVIVSWKQLSRPLNWGEDLNWLTQNLCDKFDFTCHTGLEVGTESGNSYFFTSTPGTDNGEGGTIFQDASNLRRSGWKVVDSGEPVGSPTVQGLLNNMAGIQSFGRTFDYIDSGLCQLATRDGKAFLMGKTTIKGAARKAKAWMGAQLNNLGTQWNNLRNSFPSW